MDSNLSNMIIREATAEDVARASVVFDKAFESLRSIYHPTALAATRRVEGIEERIRLVAEVNNQILGTVEYVSEGKQIHVIGLAVLPDYQRMGIAYCILKSIISRAQIDGCNIVALSTIKETGNVSLFEKMGFSVIQEDIATWCTSDLYAKLHDVRMERKIEIK